MAVTSKKETILEYLRSTLLPNIDGTGNYNLSLQTISRSWRNLEYGDYPSVFVIDDEPVMFTPKTARGYTTGSSISSITSGWIVQLWGMVSIAEQSGEPDQGLLSQEMNKLMSDLIIAMEADPDLGGNCLGISLVSSHNSLEWEESGVGIVFQRWAVKYDFNPSAGVT